MLFYWIVNKTVERAWTVESTAYNPLNSCVLKANHLTSLSYLKAKYVYQSNT